MLLNDPFLRDADATMSSFLDSMIPRDTVSNMNQFDFVVDIVEKKDKFHLSERGNFLAAASLT